MSMARLPDAYPVTGGLAKRQGNWYNKAVFFCGAKGARPREQTALQGRRID